VVGIDGSGLRPLTDGSHADREPAFSASGGRVLFTRRGDIFSVALTGGAVRRITSGGTDDFHPRAAPGGRIIAFERRLVGPHSVRHQHIFTARADGSRVRDLTPRLPRRLAAADPEFSPDGRRIVYTTGDRVISVRADGARAKLLIAPRKASGQIFSDPTFAPDGRSLLFAISSPGGRSSLHRRDLDRRRPLPNPLREPHIGARAPAWQAVPR
jgi:Tol biopolymer transport system component